MNSINANIQALDTALGAKQTGTHINSSNSVNANLKALDDAIQGTTAAGYTFAGDTGTAAAVALGKTVTVKGKTDKNITTTFAKGADGNASIDIALKDDIAVTSVTATGEVKGATLNATSGVTVAGDSYITSAGINANNKAISNVAAQDLAENGKYAATTGQVYAEQEARKTAVTGATLKEVTLGADNKTLTVAENNTNKSVDLSGLVTTQGTTNATAIGNITNGSTVVGKATADAYGNDINSTYAKSDDVAATYATQTALSTATTMSTAGKYYAAGDSVTTALGKVDTQVSGNASNISTLQGYFTDGAAKKAIADGAGNNISATYATKTELGNETTRAKAAETVKVSAKDGSTITGNLTNASGIEIAAGDNIGLTASGNKLTIKSLGGTDVEAVHYSNAEKTAISLAGTGGTTISNVKAAELAENGTYAATTGQVHAEQEARKTAVTGATLKEVTLTGTTLNVSENGVSKTVDLAGLQTTQSTANATAIGNITNGSTVVGKATADAYGNDINSTYAKSDDVAATYATQTALSTATTMSTAGKYYAAGDSVTTALGKVDTQVKAINDSDAMTSGITAEKVATYDNYTTSFTTGTLASTGNLSVGGASNFTGAATFDGSATFNNGASMGGKKVTNVANATADTDAASYGQVKTAYSNASYDAETKKLTLTGIDGTTTKELTIASSGVDTNAVHYGATKDTVALEGTSGTTVSNVKAVTPTSASDNYAATTGQVYAEQEARKTAVTGATLKEVTLGADNKTLTVAENGTSKSVDLSGLVTEQGNTNAADIAQNATAIGQNKTAIEANKTAIGQNATAIAANAEAITKNSAAIAQNATDIAANKTAISENATAIGQNKTAIEANKTAISENATAIGQNKTAIEANKTAITQNSAAIAQNATDIAANKTAIGQNATAIAANAEAITKNSAAIAQNTTDIAANKTAIGQNATAIAANAEAITQNSAAIAQNATDIAANKTAIEQTAAATSQNSAAIAANTEAIGQNSAAIADNTTAIGQNATAIAAETARAQKAEAVTVNGSNVNTGSGIELKAGSNVTLDVSGNAITINANAAEKLDTLAVHYDKVDGERQNSVTFLDKNGTTAEKVTLKNAELESTSSAETGGSTAKVADGQVTVANASAQTQSTVESDKITVINTATGAGTTITSTDITLAGGEDGVKYTNKEQGVSKNIQVLDKQVTMISANQSGMTNTEAHDNAASATKAEATAVGYKAQATAASATAVGYGNIASGERSTAVGYKNEVSGSHSGAFGDPNYVTGDGSYAFGNNNNISGNNTFVLGNNVTTAASNSVALGNGSTIGGDNEVSVGSAGKERKITNVAAGEISATSTDAVNGSQLYNMGQAVVDNQRQLAETSKEVKEVGAISAALAGLHYVEPSGEGDDKLTGAVSYGGYRGESATAVGLAYKPNPNLMVSASTSIGNSQNAYNAGISYKFGKGDTATTRAGLQKQVKYVNEENKKLKEENAQMKETLKSVLERLEKLEKKQ